MSFARYIEDEIADKRKSGTAICKLYHGQDVLPVDEALKNLGMLKHGFGLCCEVNKERASAILIESLRYHLETDYYPVMDESDAERISNQFLDALKGNPKYYVNEMWGGFEPLTHSCFDQGIIAIDNGMVGILWVMDDAL